MGKIVDKIFSFSVEELRTELAIECDLELYKLRKSQINDKLHEIIEMLDKQLKFQKIWDGKEGRQ